MSLSDLPELVGFFSYSREDDEYPPGALSKLRERIQQELRSQLGRHRSDFRVWQDKAAIAHGTLWEEEIRSAIAQSAFFVPIVTPTAIKSRHCKFEFESFLAREAEIGRNDLVFPILYIRVPALEDENRWRQDPVLNIIGARQYIDWQHLRHLDVASTEVAIAVERFCNNIFEALHRPWTPPEERRKQQDETRRQAEEQQRRKEAEAQQHAAEERRRREAEACRAAEEEQRRKEAEAQQREVEERRRRREAEARRTAEEEQRRKEAEAQQREAEERHRREAEARRTAEKEQHRKEAEARERESEERRRQSTSSAQPPLTALRDAVDQTKPVKDYFKGPRIIASVLLIALLALGGVLLVKRPATHTIVGPPSASAELPACDKAVLQHCAPNSGDTAWMLTAGALALMVTIPGVGLFYGGRVRKKNVGNTVMTSFATASIVAVLWMLVNYSLALREGNGFLGGPDRVLLQGILSDIATGGGNPNPLAPTIPEAVYLFFQLAFAIVTPALIAGAFAERMKFWAMLVFVGAWSTLVYAPVAHWVWGPDGFLNATNPTAVIGVLDFAGGTVVHINAGVAGLMACIMLGKRKDTGPSHNVVLTFIGASLLWVGWFGFTAGSALTAGMQAGMAMLVTQLAMATAALSWILVGAAQGRKPSLVGICTGAVAGLVAITPAAGFVGPIGALGIGIAAGAACYWSSAGLKRMLRYDDALDVFGIHGVGGIVGVLLTGVFAIEQYGGAAGLIGGNAAQVLKQLEGIAIVLAYSAVVSLVILKAIDLIIGLRVSDKTEREGLDLGLHGEAVH